MRLRSIVCCLVLSVAACGSNYHDAPAEDGTLDWGVWFGVVEDYPVFLEHCAGFASWSVGYGEPEVEYVGRVTFMADTALYIWERLTRPTPEVTSDTFRARLLPTDGPNLTFAYPLSTPDTFRFRWLGDSAVDLRAAPRSLDLWLVDNRPVPDTADVGPDTSNVGTGLLRGTLTFDGKGTYHMSIAWTGLSFADFGTYDFRGEQLRFHPESFLGDEGSVRVAGATVWVRMFNTQLTFGNPVSNPLPPSPEQVQSRDVVGAWEGREKEDRIRLTLSDLSYEAFVHWQETGTFTMSGRYLRDGLDLFFAHDTRKASAVLVGPGRLLITIEERPMLLRRAGS